MKVNYILIHGYGDRPDRKYFPWLRKELVGKGFNVSVPKLPNPDNPNIVEQARYVLDTEKINDGTIIVGNLLGATVALKILERMKKGSIFRLILVSGYDKPIISHAGLPYIKTIDWTFNYDKIKHSTYDIKILHHDSDKEVKKEYATALAKNLGVKVSLIKAKTRAKAVQEEKDVLKACLD